MDVRMPLPPGCAPHLSALLPGPPPPDGCVSLGTIVDVVVNGFLQGLLLQEHRDELDAYVADVVRLASPLY